MTRGSRAPERISLADSFAAMVARLACVAATSFAATAPRLACVAATSFAAMGPGGGLSGLAFPRERHARRLASADIRRLVRWWLGAGGPGLRRNVSNMDGYTYIDLPAA